MTNVITDKIKYKKNYQRENSNCDFSLLFTSFSFVGSVVALTIAHVKVNIAGPPVKVWKNRDNVKNQLTLSWLD